MAPVFRGLDKYNLACPHSAQHNAVELVFLNVIFFPFLALPLWKWLTSRPPTLQTLPISCGRSDTSENEQALRWQPYPDTHITLCTLKYESCKYPPRQVVQSNVTALAFLNGIFSPARSWKSDKTAILPQWLNLSSWWNPRRNSNPFLWGHWRKGIVALAPYYHKQFPKMRWADLEFFWALLLRACNWNRPMRFAHAL